MIYTDSAQRRYRLECRTPHRRIFTDVATLVGEPSDRCYASTTGTELYFMTSGLPYDPRPTPRPTSGRSATSLPDTVPPPMSLRRPPPGFSFPRPALPPDISSYHESRAMTYPSASVSILRTTQSESHMETKSLHEPYFRQSPLRYFAPSRDPSELPTPLFREHTREAMMTTLAPLLPRVPSPPEVSLARSPPRPPLTRRILPPWERSYEDDTYLDERVIVREPLRSVPREISPAPRLPQVEPQRRETTESIVREPPPPAVVVHATSSVQRESSQSHILSDTGLDTMRPFPGF